MPWPGGCSRRGCARRRGRRRARACGGCARSAGQWQKPSPRRRRGRGGHQARGGAAVVGPAGCAAPESSEAGWGFRGGGGKGEGRGSSKARGRRGASSAGSALPGATGSDVNAESLRALAGMVVGLMLNLAACEAGVALGAADRGALLASTVTSQLWAEELPSDEAAKHRASLLRYLFQAAAAVAGRGSTGGAGAGDVQGYAEAVLIACAHCSEGRKRMSGVANRLKVLPGVPSLAVLCARGLSRLEGISMGTSVAASEAVAVLLRKQGLPGLLKAVGPGTDGGGAARSALTFLGQVGGDRRLECAAEVLRITIQGDAVSPDAAHRLACSVLSEVLDWGDVPAAKSVPFVLRHVDVLPLCATEKAGATQVSDLLEKCAGICQKKKLSADVVAQLHMAKAYARGIQDTKESVGTADAIALVDIVSSARLALKEVQRCCGRRVPKVIDKVALAESTRAFERYLSLHGEGGLAAELQSRTRDLEDTSASKGLAPVEMEVQSYHSLSPSAAAIAFPPAAAPQESVDDLIRQGSKRNGDSDRELSLLRRSRALALAAAVLGREGHTTRGLLQALEALRLRSELYDSFSTGTLKSDKWHVAAIFSQSLFQASLFQERLGMHVDAMGLYKEGLALADSTHLFRLGCWFRLRMASLHADCGEVGRAEELLREIEEGMAALPQDEASGKSFEDAMLRVRLLTVSGILSAKRSNVATGAKMFREAASVASESEIPETWGAPLVESVGLDVKLCAMESARAGESEPSSVEALQADLDASPRPLVLCDKFNLLRTMFCVAQSSLTGALSAGNSEGEAEDTSPIGVQTMDSAQRCLNFAGGDTHSAEPVEIAEGLLLQCFKEAHGFPRLQRQVAYSLASLYSRKSAHLCAFFLNASVGTESRKHVELLALKEAHASGGEKLAAEKMAALSLGDPLSGEARRPWGNLSAFCDENGKVSSSGIERLVQSSIIEQLPADFAVVTMNLVGHGFMSACGRPGHKAIVLTRLCRGCEPVGVHIPLAEGGSNSCEDYVSLEAGISSCVTGFHLEEELSSIMTESVAAVKSAQPNMNSKEKRAWWKARILLDERLGALISRMDAAVGPWRFLFAGSADGGRVLTPQERDIINFCESEMGESSCVDSELFRLVCRSATALSDEGLNDVLRGVLGVFSCAGVEIDSLLSCLAEKIRALPAAPPKKVTAMTKKKSSGTAEVLLLEPAVLVLDAHLQGLPWEATESLASCRLYRMPSLGHVMAASAGGDDSSPRSRVDCSDVYYLLNPGGDLKATQETFEGLFTRQGWDGAAGAAPPAARLARALEERSLFLYFGHGCCEQFLPPRQVQKLRSCASAMLMGCSSGRLLSKGDFDPRGTVLAYLNAGCPAAVANLWDVTDRDIDRFASNLLEAWLQGSSDLLGDSVAEARGACKLSHLIGAAPVCYGLPVALSV